MTRRELAAARITDPRLHEAYTRCRTLNARHGRTYFLATRLLHPRQRPAIHALYGFARYTDDIVDDPEPGADVAARLDQVRTELAEGLRTGRSAHPVLAAVVDTTGRFGIDPQLYWAFLDSMRMDLTVTGYPDRTSLRRYVHGSAEVIGLQLLPVLGTVVGRAEAAPHAAALGEAFQLTNFLRDVAEDLDRGRVYLPADELRAYGVDRGRLAWCRRAGRPDALVRRALADQIAFTRAVYRRARPGIAMLDPVSRPCVATAFSLYARILDRIEDQGHNVFGARARVGNPQRLALAGSAATRALWARAHH
ncbi:phytoene/squalene synthase family protein [Amycolatopsis acidiphila]|uniref:Phytoene/squalene synthase family protein n=1 Tax=Amycolatopsis acidiphila TaxID=715473 RepID=A0A558A9F5_9PSEU|nr:phytoene/squalene synthase family protein [Amycolatopsis acidiphila]TVT20898.1 phytoene/squalene synthase family protein [Amycolatopsis acidiphila]UIJ63007.1 phytoene/squalene synthase family protein [Amycolatopsis acidiphila]GHG65607.1 phytoene synthase [Amycolatopsis acidiphila]